tara:strand:- start:365 stop:922 length:558 start_codon:yes stop_codon:yes gene_type:complete
MYDNTLTVFTDIVSFRFINHFTKIYKAKKIDINIPDYLYTIIPLVLIALINFSFSILGGLAYTMSTLLAYQYLDTTTQQNTPKLTKEDILNDIKTLDSTVTDITNTLKNTNTYKYCKPLLDMLYVPLKTSTKSSTSSNTAPRSNLFRPNQPTNKTTRAANTNHSNHNRASRHRNSTTNNKGCSIS